MTVDEARAELERIQQSDPQFTPKVRVGGYILATIGLVLLLHGTWKELLVGGALGALIGSVFVWTRGITASWYVSPASGRAGTASIGVFTAVHFISDFRVIPALIAPLVMLMQGTKLTMGVIELLTGHLVAGTSRVASGIMRAVLLGFGIVAGAQLVGVEGSGLSTGGGVEHHRHDRTVGGRRRIRHRHHLVQRWAPLVAGGCSACSTWLMRLRCSEPFSSAGPSRRSSERSRLTPFAALATRHSSAPSPLVIFLPAFRILVSPGRSACRVSQCCSARSARTA